jgi:hypothetical protein
MGNVVADRVSIAMAVFAWTITFFCLRLLRRGSTWTNDPLVIYFSFFGGLFATGMTLQIHAIYSAVDALTLPNFSRLVSYLIIALAFFLIVNGIYRHSAVITPREVDHLQWFMGYTILTFVVLLALYSKYIVYLHGLADPSEPVSLPHLLFMETLYLHGMVSTGLAGVVYPRQFRIAMTRSARLRMFAAVVLVVLVFSTFSEKLLLSIFVYANLPLQLGLLKVAYSLGTGLSGFLLLLLFLPTRFYQIMFWPLKTILGWITYKHLSKVAQKAASYCPVTMDLQHPSLWEFVHDPELYIYRVFINIQDHKVILNDAIAHDAITNPLIGPALIFQSELLKIDDKDNNFLGLIQKYQRLGARL